MPASDSVKFYYASKHRRLFPKICAPLHTARVFFLDATSPPNLSSYLFIAFFPIFHPSQARLLHFWSLSRWICCQSFLSLSSSIPSWIFPILALSSVDSRPILAFPLIPARSFHFRHHPQHIRGRFCFFLVGFAITDQGHQPGSFWR